MERCTSRLDVTFVACVCRLYRERIQVTRFALVILIKIVFTVREDCYVASSLDFAVNVGSLSECYFAGKGTALVLPDAEASTSPQRGGSGGSHRTSVTGTNIQKHLQSMFYLLRPEETLKMVSIDNDFELN
ncbi:hypothetical protein WA026_007028 [Henosepilachna vigintioctopunctata]|uniref:Uncharacterized protein n=1 Tax=Henosepilachna vigintioctopunctata TaxID=420089 RepID=A0AAW1VBM5_9CUCU